MPLSMIMGHIEMNNMSKNMNKINNYNFHTFSWASDINNSSHHPGSVLVDNHVF